MSGGTAAWVIPLALIYFVVLLLVVVVAFEPHEPGRRARHRRDLGEGGSVSAPVLRAVTGVDGVAHLVTDDAMAAGRPAGRYVARCGAEVLAASLTTPEREHCKSCRRWGAGQ